MKRNALVMLAALVAGCGGASSQRGEGPDAPMPLPELRASVGIDELWRRGMGSGFGGPYVTIRPYVSVDSVFTASPDGNVRAFDATSGAQRWAQDLDEGISAGVGFGEGLVLVVTDNGVFVALDARDGVRVWSENIGSEVLARPIAARSTAVARAVDGKVVGLAASDGRTLWSFQRSVPSLTLRGSSEPVESGGILLTGFANGKIVAADIRDGRELWEIEVATPRGRNEIERLVDIDASPLLVGSVLYAAAYQGRVSALALGSRRLLWARDISSYRDLGADNDNVYVLEDEGSVVALNRLNGATVWRQEKLLRRGLTAPLPIGEYVAVGDFKGYVHLLSKSTGELVGRSKVHGDSVSTPLMSDGVRLFAASASGALAALAPRPTP